MKVPATVFVAVLLGFCSVNACAERAMWMWSEANRLLNAHSAREEGAVYMEEQLALVETAFASNLSLDGLAIHHYGSYLELDGVKLPRSHLTTVGRHPFLAAEPTVATPAALALICWTATRVRRKR